MSSCDRYDLRSQSTSEASKAHDPPVASTISTDTRLLYQNPRKWTLDHLRIANLQQESGVSIDRIIDSKYIPSDGDSGKQYPGARGVFLC